MVMMDVGNTVLRAEGIHKRHPGVDALRGVTLSLNRGEVQVLLGVDGAGKSTLVKILAGVVQPDSGALYVDGRLATIDTPRAAAALGIGAVHQEVRLVPSMSVISNILLDYAPRRRLLLFLPLIDWPKVEAAAEEALDLLDIELDLNARAQDLSLAQQQIAKIVKALAARPRILLLDEPTYALSDSDINRLFRAHPHAGRAGDQRAVRFPPAERDPTRRGPRHGAQGRADARHHAGRPGRSAVGGRDAGRRDQPGDGPARSRPAAPRVRVAGVARAAHAAGDDPGLCRNGHVPFVERGDPPGVPAEHRPRLRATDRAGGQPAGHVQPRKGHSAHREGVRCRCRSSPAGRR